MSNSRRFKDNEWKDEKALPDGNCAFNALILGLCQKHVIDHIEKKLHADNDKEFIKFFDAFLVRAAEKLHIKPTWDDLKKKLQTDNPEERVELQKKLAPLMRKIAMHHAAHDKKYQEGVKFALDCAFAQYLYRHHKVGFPIPKDDVFVQHPFVKEKFKDLCQGFNKENVEEIKIKLFKWWEQEGLKAFLEGMKEKGMYAGDLELSQLAHRFNVNLYWKSAEGHVSEMYHDFGRIPLANLQDEQYMELRGRGIVGANNTSGTHGLLNMKDEQDINRRLQQIPDYEKAYNFIAKFTEENMRNQPLPKDLSAECIKALQERNVIVTRDNKYVIDLQHPKEALRRIDNIAGKNQIDRMIHEGIKMLPDVILINKGRNHWDNAHYVAPHLSNSVEMPSSNAVIATRLNANPTNSPSPSPSAKPVTSYAPMPTKKQTPDAKVEVVERNEQQAESKPSRRM